MITIVNESSIIVSAPVQNTQVYCTVRRPRRQHSHLGGPRCSENNKQLRVEAIDQHVEATNASRILGVCGWGCGCGLRLLRSGTVYNLKLLRRVATKNVTRILACRNPKDTIFRPTSDQHA